MKEKSDSENSNEFKDFLGTMQNAEGEFENTAENRNKLFEKYQDELTSYLADRDLPKYFSEKISPKNQGKKTAPETPKIKTETPALPAPQKSQSKKQNSKDAVKQMLIQQANQAIHRLNLETIAKAEKARQQNKPVPTSSRTYHFDGTQISEQQPAENKKTSSAKSKKIVENEEVKAAKENVDKRNEELKNIQRELMDAYSENNKAMSDGDTNKIDETSKKIQSLLSQSTDKQIEVQKAQEDLQKARQNSKSEKSPAETKKAANTGEKDTSKAELAEGYKTESGRSLQDADRDEFILKPDGSKDFGQITDEVVDEANTALEKLNNNFRLKNAPIRLQVGIEDTIDENGEKVDGFGYKHILEHIDEIQSRGFKNIPSYVEHILKNFNQIYKSSQEENRIILYCKGDQSKGLMPIDLELEKGEDNFYTVVTAYPRRKPKGGDKLLVDVHPTNTPTDTASVPHLENSNNKSGVTISRDIVESNTSPAETIPQSEKGSKAKPSKKIGKQIEGFDGKKTKVRLENNKYAEASYRIVEAGDLICSHNADDTKVDKYPKEFQPRNRAKPEMIKQMQDIAKHTDPDRLLDTTKNPNEGAPVVRSDGVALNGNGRIGGIKFGYELSESGDSAGKAIENYRDELISRAEEFGIDNSEIEDMIAPVLVREVSDNISEEDLAKLTEAKEGGAKLDPEEQARVDAKKITSDMFSKYVSDLKEDLKAKENEEFVTDILRKISTDTEFSQYFTSKGLTDAGELRVQQVLLNYALESDELVANASAIDPEAKRLQTALEKSATTFAKIKRYTKENFNLEKEYDLSAVKDAAEKYFELRRQGKKVSNYLQEVKLETEGEYALKKDTEEMRELLRRFNKYTNSGNKMTDFVKKVASKINAAVEEELGKRGSDVFNNEKLTFLEIIRQAENEVDNANATGLFSAEGEISETLQEIQENLVDEKDLTSQQKKFVEWGKSIGMPTKFFKAEEKFFGYHGEDGVSYLNVKAKANLEQTFYHETAHWLAENNRAMFNKILDAAKITTSQRNSKRNSASVYRNLSDTQIDEEILADNFKDMAKRSMLLQKIGKSDKSLLDKVVSCLKAMLDKFKSYFRNPQGGLTNQQWNKMYSEFVKNIRSLKDAHGNNYYRVNNRTHEVEYFSGGALAHYSFAGEKAKTANNKTLRLAKKLEKQGKNSDEIFYETGWFKGKDNRWRFEIPDNLDKIDLETLKDERIVTLGRIYDNAELYKAYPFLKDVVIYAKDNLKVIGQVASEKQIQLNNEMLSSSANKIKMKQALVHELQHIIQVKENFAKGGTPEAVRESLQAEKAILFDEMEDFLNKNIKAAEEKAKIENYMNLIADLSVATFDIPVRKSSKKYEKAVEKVNRLKEEIKLAGKKIPKKIQDKIKDTFNKIHKLSVPEHSYYSDQNLYNRLGGEQEAREVEQRLLLEEYERADIVPTPHTDDAIIIFGGKEFLMSNSLDNSAQNIDNADSQTVFEKYLGKGIMKMVRDTVEKEIGEHVDLDKMNDPVKRDNARDKLPYIRRLLTQYNSNTIQRDVDYKNHFAVRIEYARRCFDNDERIKNESVKQMGGNEGQERVRGNRNEIRPDSDAEGNGRIIREVNGGVSRNISGEKSGARKHFLELYEEEQKHSERRGAFSVAPDDNSNAGWTKKITNWIKNVWQKKNINSQRFNRRVTLKLQQASGYKILYRHFISDDDTIIDHFAKVIKAKDAYQWKELLPKVGEAISEKVGLPQSEEMNNYIADWLLKGALNNTSREASAFQEAMSKNPATFEILQDIQEEFQNFANMSANERMKATIVRTEMKQPKSLNDKARELEIALADDKAGLKHLVEDIEDEFGEEIADILNPHFQAAMSEGADGISKLLIDPTGGGTLTEQDISDVIDALKLKYPMIDWTNFKPLRKILEEAGGEKERENFSAFLIAKCYKELYEKNRSLPKAEQYDLKKYSEEECDEIIREGKEKFEQAQKDFVKYSNAVMTILYDGGIISRNKYYEMMNGFKDYAPTHRVFDEAEEINFADSLKRKKGGEQDIVDPVNTMLKNTVNFVRAAEKNKVKLKLAGLARCKAYGKFITEEQSRNGNEPTVTFKENGQTKYLATTETVKKAVDTLTGNKTQSDFLFAALRVATSITRATFTSASLDFAIANPIRDVQEAYIYNSKGGFNPVYLLKAVLKSYGRVFKAIAQHTGLSKKGGIESEKEYKEFLAMGGSQATMVTTDIDPAEDLIRNINKTNKQKWKSQPFSQLLRSLQSFREEVENSTRLEIYKRVKKELAKKRPDGKATVSDMRRAALLTQFGKTYKAKNIL